MTNGKFWNGTSFWERELRNHVSQKKFGPAMTVHDKRICPQCAVASTGRHKVNCNL